MKKTNMQLIPLFIYVITFYSSFRNASVYLFEEGTIFPVLLDYFFLFLIVVTLVFSVLKKKYNHVYQLDKRVIAIVVLVVWTILQSLFNSFYSHTNLIPRNIITSLLAFIVVVTAIDHPKVFNRALWSFIAGAVISAIIPLIKFKEIIGVRTKILNGTYYIGGLWNPVLISFISTGWLILALTKKKEISPSFKLIALFSFATIWIGSFAGLSRSFFLLTVLSIVVYTLISQNVKNNLRLLLLISGAALVISLIMPEAVSGILTRIGETFGNLSEEARITIWKSYLSNFPSYFLQGALGNYLDYGTTTVAFGTHSVFLNWLVQYGLIGMAFFVVVLLSTWKQIKSIKKQERQQFSMLVAWLIAYLVQIAISETGFIHASFYVGLAFVNNWGKFANTDFSASTELEKSFLS